MGKKPFLDPLVIARLQNMYLRAKFVVEGFISGLHKSPFRGFSLEFTEHRGYTPGDDLRHLDWKLYARKDRFYIKQYEEETNLKAYLIIDTSRSMSYKSNGISKLDYGSYLAAALAYLMIHQGDSVGLVTFAERVYQYIPPRQTKAHLSIIFEALENLELGNKTNFKRFFEDFSLATTRRALAILISDLFDEQHQVIEVLKHFRYKKNELIVFHLLDKQEVTFDFEELLLFKDMESGENVLAQPELLSASYQELFSHFIETYRANFQRNDIDYCQIITNQPLDIALARYLAKRTVEKRR
jgi:uncharacterized protein (DUF58 family)